MPQSDDDYSDASYDPDEEDTPDLDHDEEDTHIKSRILTLLEKLTDLINDLPD